MAADLGTTRIFGYQTEFEIQAQVPIKEYFWQFQGEMNVHGPFYSVQAAIDNFNTVTNSQKPNENGYGQVIYTDFKNKKRIKYG